MENSLNTHQRCQSNKQKVFVGDREEAAPARGDLSTASGGGIKYYRTEIAKQNQNLIYMQYLNLSYKDHLNKCISGFGA